MESQTGFKESLESIKATLDVAIGNLNKNNNGTQITETKDSIKITKNSRGYNYEFRVVAKEDVDLLDQVEYVKKKLDEKIKKWVKEDEFEVER